MCHHESNESGEWVVNCFQILVAFAVAGNIFFIFGVRIKIIEKSNKLSRIHISPDVCIERAYQ